VPICWSALYAYPVHFEVARARLNGRLLSKGQRDRGWVAGELEIAEQHDGELQRVVRVARLLECAATRTDALPPLHDAQLVAARSGWWTISGFERLPDTVPGQTACYQQSWFLVPVKATA
jgi:hypothetical protein